MKRRSLPKGRGAPSAYHKKRKVAYQYPSWVLTGRDLPKEIAALVERNRRQRHGERYDTI